jgi:GR25 family glycosyltransferase involved in LPS biosynthesis
MDIPIFCINLERATERKEYIQKEWIDKLGFDITFWKAFDKKDLTEEDKQPNNQLLNTIYPRSLYNIGEIACIKTFISLYKYLLENKYQEVIIMEDDITPLIKNKQKLFDHIAKGKIEFPSAEIMVLFEPRTKDDIIIFSQARYFFSSMYPPSGNQLLYINNQGIQKIVSIFNNMNIIASKPQQLIAQRPNKVIVSNSGLCSHDWTGEKFKSYIQQTSKNYIP